MPNEINPNLTGIKLWEHGYFGGYNPLRPLIDDITPPTDLENFNQWVRDAINTRLRAVHQRTVAIENSMNQIGIGTSGWAREQLAKYASTFYKKDYTYPLPDGYIYHSEFDATGIPYDFIGKFGEPVVIYPIQGVVPVNFEDFYAIVYKNGRPVAFDKFDLHRQQTGYTVFIPRSYIEENDTITIELKKSWNNIKYKTITITDATTPLVFNYLASDLGKSYAADEGENLGDYLVYIKNVGDTDYDLLSRDKYTVIFTDHTRSYIQGTLVDNYPVGTKVILTNNSAGWEVNYTVKEDTWVGEFPLICKHNPERIILPPDVDNEVKIDRYPLPFENSYELAVFVCNDRGENFKLVPEEDFTIERFPGNDYKCPYLKLIDKVPEFSKVRIVKLEPSSWYKIQEFVPSMPRDGIIIVSAGNIMPVNINTLDITVNNRNVGPEQLESINDRCFRIKNIDSNKGLYYRLTGVRNEIVTAILNNYNTFKPESERYFELINDYNNVDGGVFLSQYRLAHNITATDIPDASITDFSDYHDSGSGGVSPSNTGAPGVDYLLFKSPNPNNLPEVIIRGFSENELYRFKIEVNGSEWSQSLVAGRDYSFSLNQTPGMNRIRILEYDTVSYTWPQDSDAEIVEYLYDPNFDSSPDGSTSMNIWINGHLTSLAMENYLATHPNDNFILDSNNFVQFDEQEIIGRPEYEYFFNNIPIDSNESVAE